jgi:hypothetical protein
MCFHLENLPYYNFVYNSANPKLKCNIHYWYNYYGLILTHSFKAPQSHLLMISDSHIKLEQYAMIQAVA